MLRTQSEVLIAAPHRQNPLATGQVQICRLDDGNCSDYPGLMAVLLQLARFTGTAGQLQLRLGALTGCPRDTAAEIVGQAQEEGLLMTTLAQSNVVPVAEKDAEPEIVHIPQFNNEELLQCRGKLVLVGPQWTTWVPSAILQRPGLISEHLCRSEICPGSELFEPSTSEVAFDVIPTLLAARAADACVSIDFLAERDWPPRLLGICPASSMQTDDAHYSWVLSGAEHWAGCGVLDGRALLPPMQPYFAQAYGKVLAALFPSHCLLHVCTEGANSASTPSNAAELATLAIQSLERTGKTGDVALRYRMLARHLLALSRSANRELNNVLIATQLRRELEHDKWNSVYGLDSDAQVRPQPVMHLDDLQQLRTAAEVYANILAEWPRIWLESNGGQHPQ